MEHQVELLKVNKEGSIYLSSPEETYVLALPRGKGSNVGDLVIGVHGLTRVSSIYEKDFFDSKIHYLEDGTTLVNHRRVVALEEDLTSDQIQQIKDLVGPLFIRLEESGEIEIIK